MIYDLQIYFVYQKALISTFNTSCSITNNLCEFPSAHINSKGNFVPKKESLT